MKWFLEISQRAEDLKNSFIKEVYDKNSLETNQQIRFKNFCEDLKVEEEKLLIEFFTLLNFSILEGEFINSKFIESAEKIINKIGAFYQFPDLSFILDLEEEGMYNDFLINLKFLSSYKSCIEEYIKSAKFINRIFSKSQLNKNLVLDLSDKTNDIIDQLNIDNKKLEKILVQIFTQNLFLSRKEFTLRNSEEDLERLLNSKHLLFQCESDFPTKNEKIESLLDILKDKNTFLIRKLIIRKHQDPDSGNQYYVLLGEENTFSLEKHNYLLDIYNSWDEYSYNHFLSEDNLVLERKLNDYCEQIGDSENFWSKHRFAKKYKDVDKNTKALNTLTTSKISILDSDFNNFAKKISENYLKNCALSLSIEKENICYNFDLEKFLIKEKEKIQEIQYESIIKNFFPYKKVCFFIVDYIEYFKKEIGKNNFDRKKLNEIIDKIKVANNHLNEITSKFKSNLNWCKNHFFYSYQLPFEECFKKQNIGEQELNIFVPSTFSLPLNYSDLLKEVEVYESNYLSNKNDIDNFSNFSVLFNRLDTKLADQEKEIKEQSKKSIELLSVFTAILALIFGGISTLTNTTTFEEKFLTFISLFIVLFSFITLIKTFISEKKNFIEVLALFFIYIVCLILIIGVLSITIKQKLL